MKKLLISSVLILIISLPIFSYGQAETYSFTLKQSLEFARGNSIDIQKAILDQKQADYAVKEVRGTGLPQVSGSGQFQNFPNLPTQLLPGEIIGQPGTQVPVQFGTSHNLSGGFEANQLIYNQSFLTGLKAAKTSEDLYRLMKISTEEDVVYQVTNAFYQTLELQAQIEAMESNLNKLEQLEGLMKVRYENKLVTKTDYNRLRVNKANLSTQLQSLRNGYEQQKNYLKLLMGMPIASNVELIEDENLDDIDLASLQLEKNESTNTQLLQKQKELNVLNKKNIQAGYYPTLSAFGQQTWQAQRNEFNFFDGEQPWFQQTIIGLQLQVPIFDGFQKRHKVQQSLIDIQKIELDLVNANRAEETQVANAREQLLNGLKSVEVQRENKDLAKEVYDQTNQMYGENVSSLNDLLDAENALREAQVNYYREVLKFRMAELNLLKAQGQLSQLSN